MNIDMNGKKILRAEVIMADGNPYSLKVSLGPHHKLDDRPIGRIYLSATHHGDHEQFWVVCKNASGEVARFNCRNQVTGIIWAKEGA